MPFAASENYQYPNVLRYTKYHVDSTIYVPTYSTTSIIPSCGMKTNKKIYTVVANNECRQCCADLTQHKKHSCRHFCEGHLFAKIKPPFLNIIIAKKKLRKMRARVRNYLAPNTYRLLIKISCSQWDELAQRSFFFHNLF